MLSVFLVIYLGVEFAWSYGNSMFTFFNVFSKYIFQNGCTILHSHPPCMRTQISPHSHSHLLSAFFIIILLQGVKWYLIVLLICISLKTNDVNHLVMCLLVISNIFFGEMSTQIICCFFIWAFVFLLLGYKSSLYTWTVDLYQTYDL